MASEPTGENGSPFDLAKIKQLVRLMRDNDLAEIDLRWQHSRVRLRRGGEPVVVSAAPAANPVAAARTEAMATTEDKPPAAPAAAAAASSTFITSPIVGTYYSASGPDSEPFVRIGSRVSPETTVCIIEAMKVFNEIPAGVSGTIAEVLVENGSSVEFGQPLFRVET